MLSSFRIVFVQTMQLWLLMTNILLLLLFESLGSIGQEQTFPLGSVLGQPIQWLPCLTSLLHLSFLFPNPCSAWKVTQSFTLMTNMADLFWITSISQSSWYIFHVHNLWYESSETISATCHAASSAIVFPIHSSSTRSCVHLVCFYMAYLCFL